MMSRKILLAGAAAVLSGLAMTVVSAEVILSGRLIGSVEDIRTSGNNSNRAGNQLFVPRTRFNDESSYVRISGLEELGGGVQAGFQIESGFDLSGGKAAGDDFKTVNSGNSDRGIATRNSGIFMQGQFGKILFGRWDVFYDTIYLIEPNRNSLPNKISLLSILNTPTGGYASYIILDAARNPTGNIAGYDSDLGARYNNVLSYYSPDLLAGLNLQVAYVPTNESATLDRHYNGRIYMGTLTYKSMSHFPLTLVASGFQQKANLTPTTQSTSIGAENYRLTALRFGVGTKLPLADGIALQIGAVYQPSKLASGNINSTNFYRRRSYGFPLALMLGSSTFYASYGQNSKVKLNERDIDNTNASFVMAGYNYDISKRTAIGAYYVRLKNGSAAGYDFYINGLNDKGYALGTRDDGTVRNPDAQRNVGLIPRAVGVSFRHLF